MQKYIYSDRLSYEFNVQFFHAFEQVFQAIENKKEAESASFLSCIGFVIYPP
jgi:hypothetical protein